MRDPILAGARRAALELHRDARLQPSWPREAQHQADQNAAANLASSGPEPSEPDRTAPVPQTVSGTCQSDTAKPRTRGCSEHRPGNKALRCTRPILHPRAACVIGHRAKDERTQRAAAAREQRLRSPRPIAVRPVQTIVLTGTAAERINDERQCAAPAIEPDAVGVRRRSRRRVLRAEQAAGSRSRRRLATSFRRRPAIPTATSEQSASDGAGRSQRPTIWIVSAIPCAAIASPRRVRGSPLGSTELQDCVDTARGTGSVERGRSASQPAGCAGGMPLG